MTETRLQPGDSEMIAAFLDRKLSAGERREFMDRLDRDEALYEVFVETVRYREATSGGAAVIDHPARFRRAAWALPSSVAAALALVLVLPFLLRDEGLFGPADLARALAEDGGLENHLSEGWIDQGWSQPRGLAVNRPEVDSAFRAGVHSVDLEVALRLGRSEDARILVRRIDGVLENVDLSDYLRLSYRELGDELTAGLAADEALDRVDELESHARELLDLEYGFSFGRWAEAGKLAARSGNRELLGSRSFRAGLREIRKYEWTGRAQGLLDEIESSISGPSEEIEPEALEAALVALINES